MLALGWHISVAARGNGVRSFPNCERYRGEQVMDQGSRQWPAVPARRSWRPRRCDLLCCRPPAGTGWGPRGEQNARRRKCKLEDKYAQNWGGLQGSFRACLKPFRLVRSASRTADAWNPGRAKCRVQREIWLD